MVPQRRDRRVRWNPGEPIPTRSRDRRRGHHRRGALHRGHQPTGGHHGQPGLSRQPALRGPRFHRHRRVAQHHPADPCRPPRQGRPHRLLDLLVRQLRAHHPPPQGPLRRLQTGWIRHRRRPLPGVRLREGAGQRRSRGPAPRDFVARGHRQRDGHLERLPEPVLACRVPPRSAGPGRLHEHWRRRLRANGRRRRAAAQGAHRDTAVIDAGAQQHHARALRGQRAGTARRQRAVRIAGFADRLCGSRSTPAAGLDSGHRHLDG